ncbi:hypothetical protein [Pseudomonas phage Shamal]
MPGNPGQLNARRRAPSAQNIEQIAQSGLRVALLTLPARAMNWRIPGHSGQASQRLAVNTTNRRKQPMQY